MLSCLPSCALLPFLADSSCLQPGQTPGDVVVVLQMAEHSTFKRDGSNLFHKRTITLFEALTGFSFTIQHLDGRSLLVKSDPAMIVKPGDVKAIKEEGMPHRNNPYSKGNLYIEFDVTFPTTVSDASKKVLKSVLPPPLADPAASAMTDGQPEEVTLVTVDFEQEKKRFRHEQEREQQEEEDEDDFLPFLSHCVFVFSLALHLHCYIIVLLDLCRIQVLSAPDYKLRICQQRPIMVATIAEFRCTTCRKVIGRQRCRFGVWWNCFCGGYTFTKLLGLYQ